MQTPSKVVEISPARGRDERSLKWIAMACVIVYLVSLGSIFGMAMMAVQASKEVHVSDSGALVGADTGQPVAVDPITDYQLDLSYELPFLPMAYLAGVASLGFQYVDANNVITPATYQIHAVRKTAEGRATFLTAVGDTITVDGSNEVAFLESDGVSYMIIVDGGRSATDKKIPEGVTLGTHAQIAAGKQAYADKAGYVAAVLGNKASADILFPQKGDLPGGGLSANLKCSARPLYTDLHQEFVRPNINLSYKGVPVVRKRPVNFSPYNGKLTVEQARMREQQRIERDLRITAA